MLNTSRRQVNGTFIITCKLNYVGNYCSDAVMDYLYLIHDPCAFVYKRIDLEASLEF